MGEKGGFEGEIQLPGGSFSRLLLSSDDVEDKTLCLRSSVPHTPLFSCNTPKMLCFGDFNSKITTKFTLSTVNDKITVSNSNKRRNGSGNESGHGSRDGQNQKNVMMMKKNKPEVGPTIVTTSVPGHAKGSREKLGERISVLQQLVSPYGKTDTASVLHEAIGYIRFLHDQVKVLSTPYLKCLPPSSSPQHSISEEGGPNAKGNPTEGLRSRGLCLIPMESIFHVANSNGADFWSSATISSSVP